MVTARSLRAAHVAARAGYHSIGARIIRRVVVMAITAASLTVLNGWEYMPWSRGIFLAVLGVIQRVKVRS